MKKKNESVKQNENEKIIEEELIEEADQEIEELEEEKIAHLENQLKRALADYQNLERRVAEQKSQWILSANKDLIIKMLPGLDNLLLADKHTEDVGVRIAIKHFMEILEQDGVKKIKTENAMFDPNLMEAVSTTDGEMGKVVEEVKAGYTLNDDVIRVAQVVAGAGKQNN
jgi:molecular chaperone GrpE